MGFPSSWEEYKMQFERLSWRLPTAQSRNKMHYQVNQVHGPSVKQFDYLNKCDHNYVSAFQKLLRGEGETWFKREWNLKKKQEPSVWIWEALLSLVASMHCSIFILKLVRLRNFKTQRQPDETECFEFSTKEQFTYPMKCVEQSNDLNETFLPLNHSLKQSWSPAKEIFLRLNKVSSFASLNRKDILSTLPNSAHGSWLAQELSELNLDIWLQAKYRDWHLVS